MKRESKYNLPDEDEDDGMLLEKDDFDEEVPFDDESDEEGMLVLLSFFIVVQSTSVDSAFLSCKFCDIVFCMNICIICDAGMDFPFVSDKFDTESKTKFFLM